MIAEDILAWSGRLQYLLRVLLWMTVLFAYSGQKFGLTPPLRTEEGYGTFTKIYYKRIWRYPSMSIPKSV